MKKLMTSYIFNAASHTVTFPQLVSLDLQNLMLITNVTAGVIIYNFADSANDGVSSGNILTLDYNTSSMNNSDRLQIIYDDGLAGPSTVTGEVDRLAADVHDRPATAVLLQIKEGIDELKLLIKELIG